MEKEAQLLNFVTQNYNEKDLNYFETLSNVGKLRFLHLTRPRNYSSDSWSGFISQMTWNEYFLNVLIMHDLDKDTLKVVWEKFLDDVDVTFEDFYMDVKQPMFENVSLIMEMYHKQRDYYDKYKYAMDEYIILHSEATDYLYEQYTQRQDIDFKTVKEFVLRNIFIHNDTYCDGFVEEYFHGCKNEGDFDFTVLNVTKNDYLFSNIRERIDITCKYLFGNVVVLDRFTDEEIVNHLGYGVFSGINLAEKYDVSVVPMSIKYDIDNFNKYMDTYVELYHREDFGNGGFYNKLIMDINKEIVTIWNNDKHIRTFANYITMYKKDTTDLVKFQQLLTDEIDEADRQTINTYAKCVSDEYHVLENFTPLKKYLVDNNIDIKSEYDYDQVEIDRIAEKVKEYNISHLPNEVVKDILKVKKRK